MTDRIEACLVYDTKAQPLSAGVRATGQRARRFLYAAEEAELVIQVSPDRQPDHHKLSGQVLRDGEPVPWAAIVLSGRGRPAETEADDEGSFRFRSVVEGSYDLEIWADDDLIVCTPVVLGESPSEL